MTDKSTRSELLLRRRLGRTELKTSLIGLGGIGLISGPNRDYENAERLIHRALDEGINFVDVGRAYGDSEEKIGRALRGRRDECIVATKCFARSGKEVACDLETSLRMLQMKPVDIYQLHSVHAEDFDPVMAPGGALEVLKKAQRQGKIRFIGVSCHYPEVAERFIRTGEFDTVQIPYNPVDMEYFGEVIPMAREMDLGIITMKVLAGGVLNDVETALRFALSKEISVALLGVQTLEQLAIDLDVARAPVVLVPEKVEALFAEAKSLGHQFCRRCGYCLNECPVGIPIPDIFRFRRYQETYSSEHWAKYQYNELEVNASDCIGCGACEKRCPYDLPIRKMLAEAHRFLSRTRTERFMSWTGRTLGPVLKFLHLYYPLRRAKPRIIRMTRAIRWLRRRLLRGLRRAPAS